MAIDWGTEFGGNSPQQAQGSVGNAVVASGSAQSGSKMAEPQPDPVKMLQYAKDAGTRNVESMGQIGSSWFDGIPQVYDDDQIAAAKSAISRAQTPEGVQQIIQGLVGQNKGGNVGPINNALGQMGVGYSSDAGLSDIGRGIRSMTGTLDRVDVPAEADYERALQWLGNAIPNAAAIGDFAIPLPSGAASAVHLYKGAKALPGKVAGGVKAAPGKAADWYKGRYNAYSDRLAGKKPAASAAPAAERTAASETAADGGVSELANAGNAGRGTAATGGQTAGRVEHAPSSDISMATSDEIYGAVDKFMMENSGGASAVQDAIELVTGNAPEIGSVAEALRLLPRGQLEQVFMDLRSIGKAFE